MLECRRRYASFLYVLHLVALLTACSDDPNAITTPLASHAMPVANGCMLPDWSGTTEAVSLSLQSGRHDDMSLLEIDDAPGAYLTRLTGDNKLLGTFAGNDLSVTRLGATQILAAPDCAYRVEADFVGTIGSDGASLSGTLTYKPYQPTAACDCTSTVMFTP